MMANSGLAVVVCRAKGLEPRPDRSCCSRFRAVLLGAVRQPAARLERAVPVRVRDGAAARGAHRDSRHDGGCRARAALHRRLLHRRVSPLRLPATPTPPPTTLASSLATSFATSPTSPSQVLAPLGRAAARHHPARALQGAARRRRARRHRRARHLRLHRAPARHDLLRLRLLRRRGRARAHVPRPEARTHGEQRRTLLCDVHLRPPCRRRRYLSEAGLPRLRCLLLDFDRCSAIDSSAASVLFQCCRRADLGPGGLVFACASPSVLPMLQRADAHAVPFEHVCRSGVRTPD